MLIAAGETDLAKAQHKIMTEVKIVSRLLPQFFGELMLCLAARHFGKTSAEICTTIKDAPAALDVWLPFYVEIPPDDELAAAS